MRYKVFIYPNAEDHVHDNDPKYVNTVPMSEIGINRHIELCGPNVADYFYMGQFGDGHNPVSLDPSNWEFFNKYPERHIADIEGDWLGKKVPDFFEQCITTRNGILECDLNPRVFVRPTFSTFLVNAGREPITNRPRFNIASEHGFSFKGLSDPFGVRQGMIVGWELSDLPGELSLNNEFLAPIPVDDHRRIEYIDRMNKYSFALCPRGAGVDSVRYLEACYLGRCPIIIGDNAVVGQDDYDTSFMFRISAKTTPIQIAVELSRIYNSTNLEEARDRGFEARNYFDAIIKSYFKDPTKYFFDFIERYKL